MGKYIRPAGLRNNMGGEGDMLDDRMQEIFMLLKKIPSRKGRVLDIGVGKGQISEYFLTLAEVESVDGIGLEVDSYGMDVELRDKINITECSVEDMPFEDERFDIVIASHILEHVPNMGNALTEIRRVLKKGGWFYLFIPKYSNYVCAGHINTGWNIGQLMYVLLINGFDVKKGHFIEYTNLCAFVKKEDFLLPTLRGDSGDIALLNQSGLFPFTISSKSDMNDGFDGEIISVNWEDAEELWHYRKESQSKKRRFAEFVAKNLSKAIGKERCVRLGKLLLGVQERKINPMKL